MPKVSVINIQDVLNYGTMLQTFATQQKLKCYAEEVEIIDFIRKTTAQWIVGVFKKSFLKGLAIIPTALRWNRIRKKFLRENITLSAKTYMTEDDFTHYPLHDGLYCTGSDQVWNTGHNSGVISPLYLSFVPKDKRKFAFASSFGKESFTDDEIAQTIEYIKQYEQISVREDSGLKILKEQYGYNKATQIVDPTLSMTPEFWRSQMPKPKIKKDYLLIYNLTVDKDFERYAKKLAKQLKLPVYRFCPSYVQMLCYGKSIIVPPVLELISLIDNAKYVLTDSFHGTAFAMNLNTEPICVYPKQYATRLSSLLRLVKAEQRAIKDWDDFDIINRPVDWEQVNAILSRERERVDEFLQSIFSRSESQHDKDHRTQ